MLFFDSACMGGFHATDPFQKIEDFVQGRLR